MLRLCNEVHKPLVSPRPGSLRRKHELQLGHLPSPLVYVRGEPQQAFRTGHPLAANIDGRAVVEHIA